VSTTRSSFDQYCISHKIISRRAAAAPGPEVRRECPITSFPALPLLTTNPVDATDEHCIVFTVTNQHIDCQRVLLALQIVSQEPGKLVKHAALETQSSVLGDLWRLLVNAGKHGKLP